MKLHPAPEDWAKCATLAQAARRAVPMIQAVADAPNDREVCARALGAVALLRDLLLREMTKRATRRRR